VGIFSPDLACPATAAETRIRALPMSSGVAVEIPVIVLTVLLGLLTWGLYRLAVSLKEPS
jgi:hypothetical protein